MVPAAKHLVLRQHWSSIKAVCLDVDGTLYNQTSLRILMTGFLFKEWLGGRIGMRELQILRSFRKSREELRQLGMVENLDARTLMMTAQRNNCSIGEVEGTVQRWFYDASRPILSFLADDRLPQMFQRLRLRGYRLAIFSDYPVKSKLEALGIPLNLFDTVVEAGEAGVSALKPHPNGFREVCRRLNLPSRAVLYVGDRLLVDGGGARSVGMPFALCKSFSVRRRPQGALRDLFELEWILGSCLPMQPLQRSDGCWLCGGQSSREFFPSRIPTELTPELIKITDTSYGRTARLLRCADCGFIRAETVTARALEALYQEQVDDGYQESPLPRQKAFEELVKRVRLLRPEAQTLLDVGASMGLLCAEAVRAGFRAEGVEPSVWAVEEGRRRFGVILHTGPFPHPSVEGRQFDVVTLCDVIEHVSQPIEMLQAARRCLSPRGLLVVITPDIRSRPAKIMGARWWHFRPAHIGYFSRETMLAALGAAGFVLEHIEAQRWQFHVGYLVTRLESYLPIRFISQALATRRWCAPIWRMTVPVCLRDSHVYFSRPIDIGTC